MKATETVANAICAAGALFWVYGYFVTGHPSALNWTAFAPSWLSSFIPNLESEIGMVASFAGIFVAYGIKASDYRRNR